MIAGAIIFAQQTPPISSPGSDFFTTDSDRNAAAPATPATGKAQQTLSASALRHGWIGLRFVDENGPAKLGGTQNGDVLLKFNGHDINKADDLLHMVSNIAVGQQVEIVLIRSGNEETHIVAICRHNGGE